MPQRCTVCSHAKTKDIEREIVQGRANTRIADKYGLDHQSVRYHRLNHLPEKLVKASREKGKEHAKDMLSTIQELLTTSQQILDEALADDQKTTALSAIRESRNTVELMARIAAKLQEFRQAAEQKKDQHASSEISGGLQALSTPELMAFIQLQAKIFSANPDYELNPEARMVIDAITETGYASIKSGKGGKSKGNHTFGTSYQPDTTRSNPTRNRARQDKNTQKTKDNDPEMIDDLDGLDLNDLDLTKDNEIPSEETDPKWLKEERRRRRRRNR